MFFYDSGDIFNCEKKPAPPLSDEEYEKRMAVYRDTLADYKARLREAFGAKAPAKFEKSLSMFLNRNFARGMCFESWCAFFNAFIIAYCSCIITAQIRFTPKKYKNTWTAEEIDRKADLCKLGDSSLESFYRDAGITPATST